MLRILSTRSRIVVQNQTIQVRFAGGGGRPGGAPTFNWKEKLQLGIQDKSKRESISLDLTGKYKELKQRLDINNGDVDIDFTKDQQTYQKAQSHLSSVNHNIPILKVGELFGSKKAFGMLPEKPARKNFRHKRIFGERAKQAVSQ